MSWYPHFCGAPCVGCQRNFYPTGNDSSSKTCSGCKLKDCERKMREYCERKMREDRERKMREYCEREMREDYERREEAKHIAIEKKKILDAISNRGTFCNTIQKMMDEMKILSEENAHLRGINKNSDNY